MTITRERLVDVLIPTYERPGALAVTLTALGCQTMTNLRVFVSGQSETQTAIEHPEVVAAARYLEARGNVFEFVHHLPRRGMAEQRQFLLDNAQAPYALFLDDDVICEPDLVERLVQALRRERCGFIGSALIGLSFLNDVRPHEQSIELWDGPVEPELVSPESAEWERHRLHNAANMWHVQNHLGIAREDAVVYKVAWVGGCVMYDVAKLRSVGGFDFWRLLPPTHVGEDVLAEQRVMAGYGGAAIIPSGAYHQELPTTLLERDIDAPRALTLRRAS